MDEILSPAQALAQGYVSIADALKQGLSTKDRTTLYREAVSGTLPSCKVKKGSRPTLWVLKSALNAPISPNQGKSYERLCNLWIGEMRNSMFGGKPYSENTITNYKWALEKYWEFLAHSKPIPPLNAENLKFVLDMREGILDGKSYKEHPIATRKVALAKYWALLGHVRSISELNAENLRFVMGQFSHDAEARNDHYSSKMKVFEAITAFLKFLIHEGLKTKEEREALMAYRPKRRYKPKKKLVEDYEIAEAILANRAWRAGRATHDVLTMNLLLHLYGYAGLRREEAITLRREDVFFRDRLIKVFGKNSKERFVTPHPKIWPALESWFETYCQDAAQGYLLLNEEGLPYTKRSISKRFQTFSERFGKPIHPHALRRGFAVLMANLGMPLNQIQLILGHDDIKTTMGYVMTNYKHAQKWVNDNLEEKINPVQTKEYDDILDEFINS